MSNRTPPAFSGIVLLVVLVTFICGGAVVYHLLEHLGWLDAIFFAVVTATTVGYGNIGPHTPAGKIFTIFYIFASITLVFTFINHVSTRTRKDNLFSRFFSRSDKEDG